MLDKKRQQFLLLTLLIIFFIWAIWFFYPKVKPALPSVAEPKKPERPEINFDLLKTPALKEFQLFEKITPFEETIGRGNPFIPY